MYAELADALRTQRPVVLVTVIDGPGTGAKVLVTAEGERFGSLGDQTLDERVGRDALGALAAGLTGVRHYGRHGEPAQTDLTVFVESFRAPRRMIIFVERLRSVGVPPESLERLRAPIGLDIGASTPEETAISICAEIIAERAGLDIVRPLRQLSTPIHH